MPGYQTTDTSLLPLEHFRKEINNTITISFPFRKVKIKFCHLRTKSLLHRRTVSNVVPHLPFVILVMFRFHLKVNWPLDGTIGHFVADFG